MIKCWASILGGCRGRSREHLLSKSLWISECLKVKGYPWCKEEEMTIGRDSLRSHILCAYHNRKLSETDAAAEFAFRTFRKIIQTNNERDQNASNHHGPVTYEIDGKLLERWFLKTTINLTYRQRLHIGKTDEVGHPEKLLVEAAFGLRELPDKMGLYSSGSIGKIISSDDSIHFAPFIKNDEYLAGSLIIFRGFCFMLWIWPELPPSNRLDTGNHMPSEWSGNEVFYHTERYEIVSNRVPTQIIKFIW